MLDAKRGDIGSTSEAYVTSAFSTLACDSITASPYLGLLGDLGGLVSDRKGGVRSRGLLESEGISEGISKRTKLGVCPFWQMRFFSRLFIEVFVEVCFLKNYAFDVQSSWSDWKINVC